MQGSIPINNVTNRNRPEKELDREVKKIKSMHLCVDITHMRFWKPYVIKSINTNTPQMGVHVLFIFFSLSPSFFLDVKTVGKKECAYYLLPLHIIPIRKGKGKRGSDRESLLVCSCVVRHKYLRSLHLMRGSWLSWGENQTHPQRCPQPPPLSPSPSVIADKGKKQLSETENMSFFAQTSSQLPSLAA